MCFPKNFLRTPILWNIDGQLLLKYILKMKIVELDKLLVSEGKFWEKTEIR